MPFKSAKQRKACFATHGFHGAIDCNEWVHASKKLGGNTMRKPCKKCGGKKMQMGGIPKQQDFPDYESYSQALDAYMQNIGNAAPQEENVQMDELPAMKDLGTQYYQTGYNNLGQSNPYQGDYQRGMKEAQPGVRKNTSWDPYFMLKGAKTGLGWLSGIAERKRQNNYMMSQFSQLGMASPVPVENFQPNPINPGSGYMKKGGIHMKNPFSGSSKYAGRQQKEKNSSSEEMAKGGNWLKGAVNPAHKGYCTPMSKPTCTGHRRAFALMMKKKHGFHK